MPGVESLGIAQGMELASGSASDLEVTEAELQAENVIHWGTQHHRGGEQFSPLQVNMDQVSHTSATDDFDMELEYKIVTKDKAVVS